MALAEGVGSQHGDRVSLNVPPIMDKLVSGGILEFYEKGPLKYYKFHNLFKEGMGTYAQKLGDPSCLELLVHTAIAVICRMPKDGQMHDSYYILTCLRQADTVDGVVEQRLTKLDENSPLFNEFRSILILLRCELHRCMAQCQHALGFGKEAISMLNKSLDFHNEASGSELDYTPLEHGEHTDPASALKLYQLQQKDSFRLPRGKGCDFLEQLVKFHVFTLTSKVHSTYLTNNDYVNDHLTEQAYDRMRKEGRLVFCKDKVSSRKVLDCEKLAKVLMGERLAAIYCLYAEVCRQMKEANPSEDLPDEKELAWISYKICERVRQDNRGPLQDIFLLQTVISYRTYLGIKLEEAGASDITDLYKRFEELELKTFPEAASLEPNLDRGIPAPVHAPNPASLMPPQAAGLSPATTDVNAATSPSFVVTTAQTNTPGDRSTVSRPAQQTAGTSSSTNGPLPQPTFLMEKGIVKYNLNTDTYFKVSALQSKLLAKAKLHQLREEDNIESGSQIIAEIMSIIDSKYKDFNVRGFIRKNRSLNPQCAHHQELSRAHRISGQFHRDCGNFEEAIRSAILALHHQKEAAGGKLLFEHLTFRRLLVKLKRYAETIKEPFLSDRDREARLLDDLTAPSVCGDDSTQESKQHLVDLQQIQTWAVKASLKPEEATDSPN
ncbi:uncharacterized protein [Watersipora subatra]|uniref:uncharacterized protein n=1 Tax=Watersipora subatra TaxID=2589382 RepID=UPI00355BAB81